MPEVRGLRALFNELSRQRKGASAQSLGAKGAVGRPASGLDPRCPNLHRKMQSGDAGTALVLGSAASRMMRHS
jgi:hypothetical protein